MKLINLSILFFIFFTNQVFSQFNKLDTLTFCVDKKGVGLGGFDAITYFKESKPKLGKSTIATEVDGVQYYFYSEENRKLFTSSPEKYLPQFGGWCSMTLAMGRATTPVYDNFLIDKGKLFLFERTLSINGKSVWLQDPKGNNKIASGNYDQYRTLGSIQ